MGSTRSTISSYNRNTRIDEHNGNRQSSIINENYYYEMLLEFSSKTVPSLLYPFASKQQLRPMYFFYLNFDSLGPV